jgi:hypothetical protein
MRCELATLHHSPNELRVSVICCSRRVPTASASFWVITFESIQQGRGQHQLDGGFIAKSRQKNLSLGAKLQIELQ